MGSSYHKLKACFGFLTSGKCISNMKKQFIFSFFTVILISCGQVQETHSYDINGNVLVDTIGNTITEKNMKSQLEEYLVAFNTGDVDKALFYVYPDVFEFMRHQYPDEEFDIQEVKDSLFIEPMRKMKILVEEKKVEYEFEIGEIVKMVKYNDSIIYIVLTQVNGKIGLDRHSFGGEVVAISNDSGDNWKFMEYAPEFISEVLELNFPQNVIEQLLSK
jgi:hypothetical protein